MKKFLFILLITAQLLFSLEVPKLTGHVNDYAAVLSASEKQQLETFLTDYETQTSTQLVLLTIPSLGEEALEDFSIRVAEKWQIGQKGKDNGLILLIALKERKIRIEVGYGLEPTITDAFSGEVIRDTLAPAFRENRFYDGVYSAFYAITQKIGDEFSADNYQVPVYSVGNSSQSEYSGNNMETLFFMIIVFSMFASSGKVTWKRGLWGVVFLPVLIFLFLGIPFSLPILLLLMVFGFPGTFLFILLGSVFGAMRGGFYGGYSGGGSSFGGGFSGGGGSFGGGGASGGW